MFIADINLEAAKSFADDLNKSNPETAFCAKCDVNKWEDLSSAFFQALDTYERIDYVFPIAGLTERQVISQPSEQKDVRKHGFKKPDLTVLETNLNGMVNLIMVAVQAFRGQEPTDGLGGMRERSKCTNSDDSFTGRTWLIARLQSSA